MRHAQARPMTPPLTPVLLLGLALRPIRPSLLQPAFDAMLKVVRRRHPDILERMADWGDRVVCIDPVDLPFVILLEPHPDDPRLTVRREVDPAEVSATIRGPLEMLVALAEGKVDGDALFFSRQLVIEGDTEVVVALRNAIDGAGIDLIDDLASALGPFGRPARTMLGAAAGLVGRMRQDLETVRSALLAPALKDADAQAARITHLEAELKQLRRGQRRAGAVS
ncbi:MAG: ubiquinone anaerobic biosynthesis accessory factor UbiT [Actinomycetota bacterium]